METLTMLNWNRRPLAALPVVWMLWGCAADDSTHAEPTARENVEGADRLETLRAAAAPAATEDAWAANYLRGLVVERAWVSGRDLLLEAFNPASRQFEMQSVDARTGVPNWVTSIGPNRLRVEPMPGDKYVAVLTEVDGGMTVLDRRTGARATHIRVQLDLSTTEPAASSESTVFVSSLGTNRIAALNPVDGRVGWAFPAPTLITAGPVLTPRLPRRLAVAACLDGTVVAVPAAAWNDPAPEAPAWTRKLLGAVSGEITTVESAEAGRVTTRILVPCEDRGLYCLDGATGRPEWVYRTESPFTGKAVALNGVVFARNADRMVAVKLADGMPAWPSSDPAAKPSHPWEAAAEALALDGTRGYLRAGDGRIHRVDAKDGRILETARLSRFDMVLGGGPNNLLIGLTRDGYAVAFK
ncbi:MAG TPA: PQQ-binding-like beta-propeller repeat protein [Planctomycetota bacterium]|nr:PQQ-binding-like beta-propeller repeat protein [Planctomycetota bacterium]